MFLKSNEIKAYPTSYRDAIAKDINSGLFTERNTVYLKKLSQFEELNNYFTCNNIQAPFTFDLTLYGYNFVFTLTANQLDEFITNGKVFAYIELEALTLATDETTYILVPINKAEEDNNIIDKQVSDNPVTYEFKGLCFSGTEPTSSSSHIYKSIQLLEYVDNAWKTCKYKDLKVDVTEIRTSTGTVPTNLTDFLSITTINASAISATTINVVDLEVTNIANIATLNVSTDATVTNMSVTNIVGPNNGITLTGNIKNTNGRIVNIPDYTPGLNQYVLSVNSSGELYWREYYGESITTVS